MCPEGPSGAAGLYKAWKVRVGQGDPHLMNDSGARTLESRDKGHTPRELTESRDTRAKERFSHVTEVPRVDQ